MSVAVKIFPPVTPFPTEAKHDYNFDESKSRAQQVEVIYKPKDGSNVYLRLGATQNDTSGINAWLQVLGGDEEPRGFNEVIGRAVERTVFVEQHEYGDGWKKLTINLREQFKKVFSEKGYEYAGLLGFRLRGSLSICSITFDES